MTEEGDAPHTLGSSTCSFPFSSPQASVVHHLLVFASLSSSFIFIILIPFLYRLLELSLHQFFFFLLHFEAQSIYITCFHLPPFFYLLYISIDLCVRRIQGKISLITISQHYVCRLSPSSLLTVSSSISIRYVSTLTFCFVSIWCSVIWNAFQMSALIRANVIYCSLPPTLLSRIFH